jgi:lysozyme family protein
MEIPMKANFAICLPKVLAHEGGWADHPKDPGGATMKGITIGTYRAFKGRDVTKAELRAISDAEVAAIYRNLYWNKVEGDRLPSGLDYVAFDPAVNSGPARGARWLQQALGVTPDGRIGPATLAAAKASDPVATIKRACAIRMGFLKGLRTWGTFGKGWSRRVADVEAFAVKLAAGGAVARAQAEPAQAAAARDTRATAAPAAAGGGSIALDGLPEWGLVVVGVVAVLVIVALLGQARHNRNRAAAYAAQED